MKSDGIISYKSLASRSNMLIFSRQFLDLHRALIILTGILKALKTQFRLIPLIAFDSFGVG